MYWVPPLLADQNPSNVYVAVADVDDTAPPFALYVTVYERLGFVIGFADVVIALDRALSKYTFVLYLE